MLPNLIKLNPEQYRFLTVVSRFGQSGKRAAVKHPYQFEWYLQRELPYTVTVSADAAAGATTISLVTDHVKRLTGGQLLINVRTGERMRLPLLASSAFSSDRITNVVRSYGATPDQAILAGDELIIGPASRSEASADPTPIGFKPELAYNYKAELSLAAGATLARCDSRHANARSHAALPAVGLCIGHLPRRTDHADGVDLADCTQR